MSELPDELLKALETKEKAQMKHNWMYSFMPSGDYNIFLVGYCKVCDSSVASVVPHDTGEVFVTRANIPKWGCVPLQEVE